MKTRLLAVNDIPDHGACRVGFQGRDVLVFKHDGQPRAFFDYCPHFGGSLNVEGESLVCVWHGAMFSCRSGLRERGPAAEGSKLIALAIREEDGYLYAVDDEQPDQA